MSTVPSEPARRAASPLLVVFLDGVGLAAPGPDNPLSSQPLPALEALVGGPLVAGCGGRRNGCGVAEIDATLGVAGLPQSATGQTALFTGINAAERLGRHVAAYPGPRLKQILEADGLLARAGAAGREVAFANAFRPETLREMAAGRRRVSAMVYLATSAGVALRSTADLAAGRAVSWDLERDLVRRGIEAELPPVSPEASGRDLVRLAARHDLTVFDCFLTDLAGHRRFGLVPEEAARRVDRLVAGLLDERPAEMTLLICSDHGNLEEAGHRRHTRNRVPLVAVGPAREAFAGARSLLDVTPGIARALDIDGVDPFP
ncbi:MAG: metalloenzyme [Thermoanaerobaculia bacterium]|nr:metalloenzyme [Thermoanaerobaculia bacterium]